MIVLHAGCGGQRLSHPDYAGMTELRLDLDAACQPDIVGTLTAIPLADESMQRVYCSHTLEHLYAHEVPKALKEFYRVLQPGGRVDIEVPDLQSLAKSLEKGRIEDPLYWCGMGPISTLDILFGFRPDIANGNAYMVHKTGFTSVTLEKKLRKAGFVNVATMRGVDYNLHAKGDK